MAIYLKRFITNHKPSLNNELQLRFLQRLQRLLSKGYTLLAALEVIGWDKQMTLIAAAITESLKKGHTIDEAFEAVSFHQSITTYLYFIRSNGDVPGSIRKCIEMYEHRMKYTQKFQQFARYPLILLFVFSILLYFIKQSVLPSFVDLFHTSAEASFTVTVSMMIIDILVFLVIVMFILLCLGVFIWRIIKEKISIEKQIKFYNTIPVYRHFLKLQISFLFATHFSSLLKTGMPFKEILLHISRQNKIPVISHYSKKMTEELTKGFQITSLLSQFSLLENQLTAIFQKNADVEALEKDLSIYAELLTEEMQRKIIKAITLIQPIFFLILASFIIFVYVTLMWPMFQLIKTI
ncbi:competence type IV pilus assembly protein ComGB [Virgibacillus sp. C22-A2]|uniref:Competence type IV pilus assembly protein ComGB n=1 Tax=Virgibacillus tibetensis TaxID=3042313 RepID=A0ABU6KBH8_9BACI|nr:competence type IV pilus assembly protein ComGB [Virgibacillus sp. C22-A2]